MFFHLRHYLTFIRLLGMCLLVILVSLFLIAQMKDKFVAPSKTEKDEGESGMLSIRSKSGVT